MTRVLGRMRRAEMRAILGRMPRAAWVCALVACMNAVCWSIVTPAFEVPDEPDHYSYVKQLAETGRLPSSNSEISSNEVIAVLIGLRYNLVRAQPQNHTIASRAEQHELDRYLAISAQDARPGSPAAGVAASQPPLYYAIESIPYLLAKGGSVLDRLALMRLTSALFAGVTALFSFLFVREALPGAPWAWTVGGLGVALMPLLGFMSGAVNPDAMLFAVSAAIFYCFARAFRRGLGERSAATLGALAAIGFLTKLNFVGLAPGVFAGLVVLSVRAARVRGRSAYRLLALSLGIALSPVAAYAAINTASGRRPLGIVSATLSLVHGSLLAQLNYIWQLYLPRLPGTVADFPGISTTLQLWFRGYVGLYGWLDTPFPGWVSGLALIPAAALALLCARALVRSRQALRARASELAVYATLCLGLIALVGADSYLAFPHVLAEYAQVRYMLPLLPLLGGALTLAARGAGRRAGPAVGAVIVVLFLAHDVFSQLLVVGRYYG
jgi:4-amino-4-deoxy-L-arabinose transferase-like glycosyltransferase